MQVTNLFSVVVCSLLAPAAVFVAGCDPEEDPLTRDEFCERWGTAVCGTEVTSVCQTSQAACQASQAASCRDWLPNDFQDVGANACLNAVTAAYADADLDAAELEIVWRLGAPCNGLVVAGEGGEACERDADCSGSAGLTCVLKDRATGTCERAETVSAGRSCKERNQTCDEGFYCNGDNCIVAAELGEDCNNDNQCEEGLFCEGGVCETQLSVGADCATDRECESEICYEVDTNQRICVNRIRLSPAEPACATLK